MTIEPEQAEAVSGQLSRLTTESRDLNAGDVSTSVDIVDKILDSQVNGTDEDVARNVLQIVNNLLNAGNDVLAAIEEQDDSASRMIKAVEQVSQGIVVQGNESVVVTTLSISLTVVAIDENNFDGLEFGVYSAEDGRGGSTFSRHEDLPKENLQTEIYLPPTIFQDLSTEEQSRIAIAQFISYKTNALFHV
ncbi:adhesion G-protein coupled receptor G6-like [Ptychodera flava]|uniref:adhesion G-protein coupled receptor G6-like n=1 Tax=Ptychodera flava TaxID=63121 RepID=UPI003969DB52